MTTTLETIGALALLPDEASVTITVRAADLRLALEHKAGGPELMTTTQAAKLHGYTGERWRRWAQAGVIEGAYQDALGGPWHLPRTSVEAHLRAVQRRGAYRTRGDATLGLVRSVPRGPWKANAQKQTTSTPASAQ